MEGEAWMECLVAGDCVGWSEGLGEWSERDEVVGAWRRGIVRFLSKWLSAEGCPKPEIDNLGE